jgi:hypothetical protein
MTFLKESAPSEGQQKMYDADVAEDGFVWDNSRLWAHQPDLDEAFSALPSPPATPPACPSARRPCS